MRKRQKAVAASSATMAGCCQRQKSLGGNYYNEDVPSVKVEGIKAFGADVIYMDTFEI